MKELCFQNECWYKDVCNNHSDNCKQTCIRYIEMNYLISNCGMPNAGKYLKKIRPEKIDLQAYRTLQAIKDEILDFVNNGSNLYIYSCNCGNGKTTWALKLLYSYFHAICMGNGLERKGYFICTPDYLADLKNSDYRNSYEYRDFYTIIKELPLIVWDDICFNQMSNMDYTSILSILSYRELHDKANIFTGNLNEENLRNIADDRLFDRIWRSSTRVEFKGNSRRC